MAIPINILVVEDSEPDTILMIEELKCHGYEVSYERVETAEALRSAIQQHSWNLVLSDYSMPQFNGLAALEIVNQLEPDIPFIFVSGTQGEEAAVHMIKAGANDYIIKSQLSRLVPAIERELKLAGSRRQVETTTQHLAAIVKSNKDAIYSADLNGIILSWNLAASEIYGYQADEIIGQPITILFSRNQHNKWLEILTQICGVKLIGTYETERQRKDGRIISTCLTTSPINDTKNQLVGISVIARDISAQKKEEQDRLKLIQELTSALN